jgi:hypothetical protein
MVLGMGHVDTINPHMRKGTKAKANAVGVPISIQVSADNAMEREVAA